ncbi:MAG: adenosylcobinamide-GDP ribazoletransferase [Hyphomicrobium sp.]|uniref:adenosylcobinamide-GDP ribazoletransferase n=1 Tax=Hyphomicrobium sp. TaxID=82 RepID=UPI003D0A3F56
MTGFFAALGFLTRIPAPAFATGDAQGDLARAAPWLPVVGALVGAYVALALTLGAFAGPWIAALAGILTWVIITGALHLDGLADVADGLGAAHGDTQRFLEVARDSHLGSFGAVALVLQIAAKLILLAALAGRAGPHMLHLAPALILIAAWARWLPLALASAMPPLAGGMASRLAAGIRTPIVIVEAMALAALSAWLAPVLLAALPLAAGHALYWRARLGGITGDCHGASIEIMESLLLLALLLR